jgi:hypothetical protein
LINQLGGGTVTVTIQTATVVGIARLCCALCVWGRRSGAREKREMQCRTCGTAAKLPVVLRYDPFCVLPPRRPPGETFDTRAPTKSKKSKIQNPQNKMMRDEKIPPQNREEE